MEQNQLNLNEQKIHLDYFLSGTESRVFHKKDDIKTLYFSDFSKDVDEPDIIPQVSISLKDALNIIQNYSDEKKIFL